MNPIVFLKNVNISQNNTSVLSNINLSVNKGEFIYFIGKTGVGKSSLLRILYGDIIVKKGEARILDTNLTKLKDKEIPFLRRKLGVVFQDFKLLPNKTIKKNLEFVLRATEWNDSDKINSRIIEVLKKVNLEYVIDKYPFELSGGEQQRVAIARALIAKTDLILADEPTGNLDFNTSRDIFSYFLKLKKLKKTIIYATHNRDLANKADYKLSISNGNIKRING